MPPGTRLALPATLERPARRYPLGVEPDRAELSSMASLLDQLADRFGRMADAASAARLEDLAAELVAVERALAGARRRLARLLAPPR